MTKPRAKSEALSKTCKSFIRDMIKEDTYGVSFYTGNKYCEKGTILEDEAIDLVADYYSLGFQVKNEEYYKNDYICGTPDLVGKGWVRDIKCSWSAKTFPLFEDEIDAGGYYWQLQGYMALTNAEVSYIDFCLMDTPVHLIERETRMRSSSQGSNYDDLIEKVRNDMTYSQHPTSLRVKTLTIERNQEDIEAMYEKVKLCNEYYDSLINQIKTAT